MLPFATVTYFHEEQRFRESRLWLAIAVPFAIALWIELARPGVHTSAVVLVLLVALAVAAVLAVARLETTVTDQAIVVTFHGLWPTRRIKLDDIAEYAPVRYSMWDSGGWGIHFGLAGLTYNVRGNDGLRFRLKSGSRVLIGTQHPAEFAAAVATARAARGSG